MFTMFSDSLRVAGVAELRRPYAEVHYLWVVVEGALSVPAGGRAAVQLVHAHRARLLPRVRHYHA